VIIFSARQSENDEEVSCLGLLEITSIQIMHINREFKPNVELKHDLMDDSRWKISRLLSHTQSHIQSHYNLGTPLRNSIIILIWIWLVLLKWSSLILPTYYTLMSILEHSRSAGRDKVELKASPQECTQRVPTARGYSVLVTWRDSAPNPPKHRRLRDWFFTPDTSVSSLAAITLLHLLE